MVCDADGARGADNTVAAAHERMDERLLRLEQQLSSILALLGAKPPGAVIAGGTSSQTK